jgi:hypothetical protein
MENTHKAIRRYFMKKIFLLGLMVMFAIGMTSAVVAPSCSTVETGTVITGKILDASTNNLISGANVKVSCNENDLFAISDANGQYSVAFSPDQCGMNDSVSVSASGDGLNGEESGVVNEKISTIVNPEYCPNCCLEIVVNVGCIDVPLIPEFGVIVALTTIFGAIGVFFFVRRH